MENDAQLTANGVLEAWRSFCSMLAANKTRDDQFELRLICGAASTETAAAFLAPIHDLPRLKALSIRIGPNRNFDIQNMVMKTIRQKTTYFCPEPERSFPFLKLPVELQLRALEHTGLIASRHFIFRIIDKRFTSLECRLFKCAGYPIGFRNSGDNYCPSTHTAFSTAYPCEDFIPDALFLVSKTVRLLALSVFYSRNTFEVCYQERGLLPHVPPPVEAPWSPQTSRFIRQFPAHSWQHLRHVRWVFCCLRRPDTNGYSEKTDDWSNSLTALFSSGAIRPSSFTLELHFNYPYQTVLDWPPDPYQTKQAWDLCDRIVSAVIPWKGFLKDFFVHNYGGLDEYSDANRRPREALLEQKVMGKGYDSFARGKVKEYRNYL